MIKCYICVLYQSRFQPLPAADELQKERNRLGRGFENCFFKELEEKALNTNRRGPDLCSK